jgi:hypothetical protein
MNDDLGLPRALDEGDYVILSTGAVARARAAYPPGYVGTLELELDGQPMKEQAERITLPQTIHGATSAEPVQSTLETHEHHAKEHDHRMKD